MKERMKNIITVIFCLLSVQLSAKTIYYVKSGATGTGTSWSNASGSIQAMIDEASPGDEIWIAGGTYVAPPVGDGTEWWRVSQSFILKSGISLFGGFKGIENSLEQRDKKDRNRNGRIESWEFSNETILSGYSDDKNVQWKVDDSNNILDIVSGLGMMSPYILYCPEKNTTSSYSFATNISGFTITGGRSACLIESSDCFVISDCEICYNGNDYETCKRSSGCKVLELAKEDNLDFRSGIKNSSIHHNLGPNIACYGDFIENCIVHHNQAISGYNQNASVIHNFISINKSEIYANVHNQWYSSIADANICYDCKIYNNLAYRALFCNILYDSEIYKNREMGDYASIYAGIAYNCKIYENEGNGVEGDTLYNCDVYNNIGHGMNGITAYNCHIYGNQKSGAYNCNLYDCTIENNTTEGDGGGASGSYLQNCTIRNNFAVGNGGGCDGGSLKNCKIYNNESLFDGGGISGGTAWGCSIFNNKAGGSGGGASSNGKYYNCDIYNNSAVSYGGVSSGSYTNCTIANNKTFSGNDNSGSLTNCILKGTFEGSASYSAFTDSYIQGDGNFLVTEKELKLVKSSSFIGNASNEKQLEELNNADFSLSKGSIAIDMGKSGYLMPVEDKSGYPRPMGDKMDIGSHEYFSLKTLPYENKFDEASISMNFSGRWRNGKLPGKNDYYLYYDGESSSFGYYLEYVTTTFFDKTVSNKINLSFDVAAKYKTKDQQDKMHVILAYLDSNKQDTIMTFSNTDYIQDLHFSKEISSWVKNKVFRVLFAIEDSRNSANNYSANTVYCGITNLKITKQDASVEIIAGDKVYMYDGKSHAIDYQINDTRVDKKKAVVTYQKEGETTSTTTPPVKAGIYQAQISIEDGAYFGMKEVKLTIEKANQTIQWAQQLRTMKAKEKMQLEATATSGLPVSFSSEDETRAKVESINGKWWLVADTVPGEVSIKASQLGNENYNLANSVLKTIRIESVPTGILSVTTNKATAYFVKAENCISVKNIHPNSQLYLYDSLGHLCIMKDADNTEMQIPVHELRKGVYYLLVIDRSEKENFKILIN